MSKESQATISHASDLGGSSHEGVLRHFAVSPKRFAFTLQGISQNNVVSYNALLMMMWIDALFHFYLVIIQIIAQ